MNKADKSIGWEEWSHPQHRQIGATGGKRRGLNYTHIFILVLVAETILGWAIFMGIRALVAA